MSEELFQSVRLSFSAISKKRLKKAFSFSKTVFYFSFSLFFVRIWICLRLLYLLVYLSIYNVFSSIATAVRTQLNEVYDYYPVKSFKLLIVR